MVRNGKIMVAAVLLGFLLLCPVVSEGADPINISCATTLTGPISVNGADSRDGVLLAAEEINEAGGLLGRPLRVFVRDDQCMTATFTRETEKLINDQRVAVMLGIACGPIEVAMTSLSQKYDMHCFAPAVLQITQHKFVKGEGTKQFFAALSPTSTHALAGASFIVKNMGKKKIYLVGTDFIYPQENLPIYEQVIKNAGAQVVGSEYVPMGTVDFAPLLSKVRRANPDCIAVIAFGQDVTNFINQAFEYGLLGGNTVAYADYGTGYTQESAVKPEALPYTYWGTPFYWEFESPATKAFVTRYVDKYGKVPAIWSFAGYLEVKMWAQAVKKAGALKGEALTKALLETKGNFGNGEVAVRSFDHTVIGNFLILQGKKPEDIKSPYGWDLLKIVATKPGENFALTREELGTYPVKINRVP